MRQLKIATQITVREKKSITAYFNDINKYPLIEADQEAGLAIRIKEGDQIALQKLINGNLRFVVSVAKQYQNKGISLEDLISEGNLGLVMIILKALSLYLMLFGGYVSQSCNL